MLGTAIISILDRFGNKHPIRVALDSCSHVHFITEKFAKLLNLRKERVEIPSIQGVENQSTNIKYSTETTIESRISNYNAKLNFLIVKNIASKLPSQKLNYDNSKIPPGT